MAKIKLKQIPDIRIFSERKKNPNWLPSISGEQNFKNTFTLEGKNLKVLSGKETGGSSKGEINILTDFGSTQNNGKITDFDRFALFLHCLNFLPFKKSGTNFFTDADNSINNKLFSKQLQDYLFEYQMGKGNKSEISRGLACEVARFYRANVAKDVEELKDENLFTYILDWINRSNGNKKPTDDYQNDVAGVLGRVTYDSVIKHTLYNLLYESNIISQDLERKAVSWTAEAAKIQNEPIIYIDRSGGPYARGVPVVCVLIKDASNKTISDLINISNEVAGNTFNRKLEGEKQLVSKIGGKDKNFISIPVGTEESSKESYYCIIYDLVKILVLDQDDSNKYTLDLLRIGISFLSTLQRTYTKKEFLEDIQATEIYLSNALSAVFEDEEEDTYFNIKFKNKHSKEVSYALGQNNSSVAPKMNTTFAAQLELVSKALRSIYDKIVDPNTPENFTLHYDNFYNLLAITYDDTVETQSTEINESLPFKIEEYKSFSTQTDLIPKFFSNTNLSLKNYGEEDAYSFKKSIAIQKIYKITDVFIKQLYDILDENSSGIVYENQDNSSKDDVLKLDSINLLKQIEIRTGIKIVKNEYFNTNSKLKKIPQSIKKIDIENFNYFFDSVGINKIRLQTLSHFLFIERKSNPNLSFFKQVVYYPYLIDNSEKGENPPPSEKKLKDCPEGQIRDEKTKECLCKDKSKPINGKCPATKEEPIKEEKKCTAPKILKGEKCVCPDGSNPDKDGNCKASPPDKEDPGTDGGGGNDCPDGSKRDDKGKCRCEDGSIPVNGKCPPPPPPPPPPPKKSLPKDSEDNDFLINNIITSELACYGDIAESVDRWYHADTEEDKLYYMWQTITYIALPVLLAYVSQLIASKLNELRRQGETLDPNLAECVEKDIQKVKKTIITYADLLANLDNTQQLLGILVQELPAIPQLPNIPFLLTFDAEKELKRKVIEWAINGLLKAVSEQVKSTLQALKDICNSDSYLTGFLENAFTPPDNLFGVKIKNEIVPQTGQKRTNPTPSGRAAGSIGAVYVPYTTANINELIEKSQISTKREVYGEFRGRFFADETIYTNQVISDFFDKLSTIMDPIEMVSLFKNVATPETKNKVLSFIKYYSVNPETSRGIFNIFFEDLDGVSLLFIFLSNFIDYRICYEIASSSMNDFKADVCLDPNSNFIQNLNYFSAENIDDQIADLTKTLDDICKIQLPATLDLLEEGPVLLTTNFVKDVVDCLSFVAAPTSVVVAPVTDNLKLASFDQFPTVENNFLLQKVILIEEKSKFFLEKAFEIAMSFQTFSVKIGLPNQFGTIVETEIKCENTLNNIKFNDFLKKYSEQVPPNYTEKISFEDFDLPPGFFEKSPKMFMNIIYNKTKTSTDSDYYIKKESDKQIISKYFIKKNQVPKYINELWNLDKSNFEKSVFKNVGWVLDIDKFVNNYYVQENINTTVGDPLDDQFIKSSYNILLNKPSLKELFNFAFKLYDRAREIRYIELGLIPTDELYFAYSTWGELSVKYLSQFQYQKYNDKNVIKSEINNLGNDSLKASANVKDSYLKEYEILRKTNTRIYIPSYDNILNKPGTTTENVINFAEE